MTCLQNECLQEHTIFFLFLLNVLHTLLIKMYFSKFLCFCNFFVKHLFNNISVEILHSMNPHLYSSICLRKEVYYSSAASNSHFISTHRRINNMIMIIPSFMLLLVVVIVCSPLFPVVQVCIRSKM